MSDKENEREVDPAAEERAAKPDPQPDPGGQPDPTEADPAEQPPRISLDRYMSRRRPPLKSPAMQIFSLLMMLTALIMIFAFKNRCGLAVADFFGGTQQTSQPASQHPGAE